MSELKGITAAMAIPTYGPVDSDLAKHVRAAMMHASNRGLRWAGDMSTDKVGWGAARNMSAQALLDLKGEADGLVWIDSDIEVPADAISRLIVAAKEHGAHVLSGVYHKKKPPYTPVIYHFNPADESFFEIDDYTENLVIQPGGCGFGFVWTSYEIIKQISEMPDFDPERGGWFPDTRYEKGGKGEDLSFCLKVQRLGHPIFVDTGIQVGHAGDSHIARRVDFLKIKQQIKDGTYKTTKPTKWGIE